MHMFIGNTDLRGIVCTWLIEIDVGSKMAIDEPHVGVLKVIYTSY